jgi:hypothetical protein
VHINSALLTSQACLRKIILVYEKPVAYLISLDRRHGTNYIYTQYAGGVSTWIRNLSTRPVGVLRPEQYSGSSDVFPGRNGTELPANQKLLPAVVESSLVILTPLTVTVFPLALVTLTSTLSAPNPLLFIKVSRGARFPWPLLKWQQAGQKSSSRSSPLFLRF